MSNASPRVLDWSLVLPGLAQLYIDSPQVLENNVLVGGAACMFYRNRLKRINDPDFQVRAYTEEEETFWLSRDADFATTNPEEVPDSAGGVPLGRLQMGFVLGAEEFKENARKVRLRWEQAEFDMLIADPLDLWREKEAAVYRRRRPQDSLHLEVLGTFLQWEIFQYAGKVATGELAFEHWASRVADVGRRWNGVLKIGRLRERLLALNVADLTKYVAERSG